jgi:hypothetical protein
VWISDSIPGEIQGKPLITQNGPSPGEYIFFTHNQNVTIGDPIGSFSMVMGSSGSLVFTEMAGDSPYDPDQANLVRVETLRLPYSPLGVAHDPENGRYPGGEGNTRDLLIWSTSANEGRGDNGYTRAFQLPRLFTPEFVCKSSVLESFESLFARRKTSNLLLSDASHIIFEGKSMEHNR